MTTILHYLFFPEWSGFFLTGIVLAALFGNQKIIVHRYKRIIWIVFAISFPTFWAYSSFWNKYQTRVTPLAIILAIFLIGIVVFLIPQIVKEKIAKYLGEPSYATYLMHQNLFKHLYKFQSLSLVAFFYEIIIILFLFLSAYLIHKYIELKIIIRLRKNLKLH
jgi:peptidoglycan/LPS O-acetylase OafA/YrhL